MEGGAKIKLSSLLRSNAYANRFSVDYEIIFEADFGLQLDFGSDLEGNCYKVCFLRGAEVI